MLECISCLGSFQLVVLDNSVGAIQRALKMFKNNFVYGLIIQHSDSASQTWPPAFQAIQLPQVQPISVSGTSYTLIAILV